MASAHFGEGQNPGVEYLEAVAAARAARTILEVPPIARGSARQLTQARLASLRIEEPPAEAIELILDLSRGNPLILRELVLQLAQNKALVSKLGKYASSTLAQATRANRAAMPTLTAAGGGSALFAEVRAAAEAQQQQRQQQEQEQEEGAKMRHRKSDDGGCMILTDPLERQQWEAEEQLLQQEGYAQPGQTTHLTVHHLRALLDEMLGLSPRLRGLALQDFGMLTPRALMVAKAAAVYDTHFTRNLLRKLAAPLLGERSSTRGAAPQFDAALTECIALGIFTERSLAEMEHEEAELAAAEGTSDAGTQAAASDVSEVVSGLPSGSGGLLTVLRRADPKASHALCFGNPLTQMAVMDLLLEVQLQQISTNVHNIWHGLMWKVHMLDDAHKKHLSDLVHVPHIERARDIKITTRERQKKMALQRAKERRPTGIGMFNMSGAAEAVQRRSERSASKGSKRASSAQRMAASATSASASTASASAPPPPPLAVPQSPLVSEPEGAAFDDVAVSPAAVQARVQV